MKIKYENLVISFYNLILPFTFQCKVEKNSELTKLLSMYSCPS